MAKCSRENSDVLPFCCSRFGEHVPFVAGQPISGSWCRELHARSIFGSSAKPPLKPPHSSRYLEVHGFL